MPILTDTNLEILEGRRTISTKILDIEPICPDIWQREMNVMDSMEITTDIPSIN